MRGPRIQVCSGQVSIPTINEHLSVDLPKKLGSGFSMCDLRNRILPPAEKLS